jgi:hypothetical protein
MISPAIGAYAARKATADFKAMYAVGDQFHTPGDRNRLAVKPVHLAADLKTDLLPDTGFDRFFHGFRVGDDDDRILRALLEKFA